jgi:serine protease SohB
MGLAESYGLFLLQAVTIVVAVAAVFAMLAGLVYRLRDRAPSEGSLSVRRLDRRLRSLGRQVRDAALPAKARKTARKADRKADADAAKAQLEASAGGAATKAAGTIYVLDFDGDIGARQVGALAEEVNAILAAAADGDEVLVRLSSPGGVVHGYGLGAAQLERLRRRGLRLTVAVDKIAASGGYMMAAVADHIIAAPFAVIGSIGVVGTVPNFHRLLERGGVEVEQHTAGRYKRTLSMLTPNDDAGREKFRAELGEIHRHFQAHLERLRPAIDLEQTATGEAWLGEKARELGLVDEIGTSDDWLLARREHTILALCWTPARSIGDRFGLGVERLFDRVAERLGWH